MHISSEEVVAKKVCSLTTTNALGEFEINEFIDIMNIYFSTGRPNYFSQYKEVLLGAFPKILEQLTLENIFKVTHRFFLLVRTNNPTLSDRENQDEISRRIFLPFQKKLAEMLPYIEAKPLVFEPKSDTYVIVTRHAITQGMYAPGKFLYSVCNALLNSRKNVILVNFGHMDETFGSLDNYDNFTAVNCSDDLIPSFFSLREIIKEFQPKEILTEIELSALNLIEAIGVSAKVCLLSAGVFKTPWFDKKYLVTELYQEADKLDPTLVPIPQVHSREILAPSCPEQIQRDLKNEYGLNDKFVIGSFGRYEKFTSEFLQLAKVALEAIPHSVLILAGANDQTKVADFFCDEIKQQKVILFGVVKTPIIGWIIDIFLEPFPGIAGFAALESLAKGKPVFTLNCPSLGNYKSSRVPDLIFETESDLVQEMSAAAASKKVYDRLSRKSLAIAQTLYDDTSLANSISFS